MLLVSYSSMNRNYSKSRYCNSSAPCGSFQLKLTATLTGSFECICNTTVNKTKQNSINGNKGNTYTNHISINKDQVKKICIL